MKAFTRTTVDMFLFLTISFILVGCNIKESDKKEEVTTGEESVSKQTEQAVNKPSVEENTNSPSMLLEGDSKKTEEEEVPLNSVIIKDTYISLNMTKSEMIELLDEGNISYSEYSYEPNHELALNIGENKLFAYYDNAGKFTRLSIITSDVCTSKGITIGSTITEMIEIYGESFKKQSYNHKGRYEVYRYYVGDSIIEFGAFENDLNDIQNIEIYLESEFPIYDYGEEID